MAVLGRESAADQERAERVRLWVHSRSIPALLSVAAGAMARVDSVLVVVLALIFGPAAIVLGVVGLRQIARQPQLHGRRLCYLGITLGCLAMVVSVVMWLVVFGR